jgi:protein gp37
MGEKSKIEWTDHTFNPWTGCTKVSPGCDHCYAEAWSRRSGIVEWGNHPRRRTTSANWNEPVKWNAAAKIFKQEQGHRPRVFCASLADVFDNQVPAAWREDL